MSLKRFLANSLWISSGRGRYHSLIDNLDFVEETQRRYLALLTQRNSLTVFGKYHNFHEIHSPENFQQSVPLSVYEDYAGFLERIAAGEWAVLTDEPVILFQPTSGSTSASKLIPYTQTLKHEFQRAISAWVGSLYGKRPELLRGSAYWSISPPGNQPKDYGRIPVGFDSDSEYLGSVGRYLFKWVSAIPTSVAQTEDMEIFFDQTLSYLVATEDLAIISVWSPTFLLILLNKLVEKRQDISRIMRNNHVSVSAERALHIEKILQKEPVKFESIWPHLKLLSCWIDGPSEIYAEELQKRLPSVEIQGKGLIATEAFVSLPLFENTDPVLAIKSHFFEFQDIQTGVIKFAWDLTKGKTYSVFVTTGGGLYRYALGDLVTVTGFAGNTPTLRFVCKEKVSNYFGEKLNTIHVQDCIQRVFTSLEIKPSFVLVAPMKSATGKIAYCLFMDCTGINVETVKNVRRKLEDQLCFNFHYKNCRNLQQLNALNLFMIECSAVKPGEVYIREMQRRGLKLGDIKHEILDRETGWERCFSGHLVDA